MLRISEITPANSHVVLRLEGSIAGPWVTEARNACEQILRQGRTLHLVLAEIEFMDAGGVALVSDLRERGALLVECSPFVEEQLRAVPKRAKA
jgi:ABC-type transporter Mla MlaB component